VPYMYLDAKRLVTVGIGHLTTKGMLANIPFVHKNDPGKEATLAEKIAEFDIVNAASTPKYSADSRDKWYKENIKLVLKEETVNALFDTDLAAKEKELKLIHPNLYTAYSPDVRFAMLDLIFNVGGGRDAHGKQKATGLRSFVSFNKAIRDRKFDVAAEHSHRKPPVQESRNRYVKRLLLTAADEEKRHPKQPSATETGSQPSKAGIAEQIKSLPTAKAKPGNTAHTHHIPHKTHRPDQHAFNPNHQRPQGTAHTGGTEPPKPYRAAPVGHPVNTHKTGHHR